MIIVKTYSITSDINEGEVNELKLDVEIRATAYVTGFASISKEGDNLHILGDVLANESALDNLVFDHVSVTLDEYKVIKINAIEDKTDELIALGFTYATCVFSLSVKSRLILSEHHVCRADMTYPIKYTTIDELNFYNIEDATDMHNMFIQMLADIDTHRDSGNLLKDSVRAAVDKAGVDAVTDAR